MIDRLNNNIAFNTFSGYIEFKTILPLSNKPTKFIWSKPDRNIPKNNKPTRRVYHSSTILHDHEQNNLERLVVFGGWNGYNVLNDVWIYSPSIQWGREGKWISLTSNTGKYLEVRPNLLLQTVEFFGYNENFESEADMPKRYMHTAVSLSTGFTSDGSNQIKLPRESLMVYGGVGTYEVVQGDNWNRYGLPWGGKEPDLFALCLDDENDKYCMRARNLLQ
jgi:hypothetical protein